MSSEQPSEPKSLDIALNVAGDEKIRSETCFCSQPKERVKADLHDATLTHATSLRRAYDMTWDHLLAHDFFSVKKLNMQKFAPGFTERKS